MDGTHGVHSKGQLPLAGAILCCTAIPPEQRAQMSAIATQMGAAVKLDLTSDVTHLIVGSIDSAKYRYVAKCRQDVQVLAPSWLEALRDVWMEGEDEVDVVGLEKLHRLPAFFGLKVCLTGFDDPEQRRYIQDAVVRNGAEYHGDLTKVVTHLIASSPNGKKYEHAINWRMKVVSLEWFEQSLERGMALDESLYDPRTPTEKRGVGAWDRSQVVAPTTGKRTRDTEPAAATNPLKRKLRRSASTKFGTQSDALWAGITSAGFTPDKDEEDDWREDTPKQITPRVTPRDDTPTAHAKTSLALDNTIEPEAAAAKSVEQNTVQSNTDAYAGIFQNRIVVPHAFDDEKTSILREHLRNNGARVLHGHQIDNVPTKDLGAGFLVLPHDARVDLTSGSLPERAGSMILVTNWWVERCLHGKSLVDPSTDVWSRPFDTFTISGFSGLIVNSTGYSGIELLHVTKAVALMGAVYDELLSAKTSVLVCNTHTPAPLKLKFAADRRIPAVHATWLEDCLDRGEMLPYDAYMLNKPAHAHAQPQAAPEKPIHRPDPQVENSDASRSRNESFKLQQKEAQEPRMIIKPRGPLQPRTLDMAVSADAAPVNASDTFIYNDDDGVNVSGGTQHDTPLDMNEQLSNPLQDRTVRPVHRISDHNVREGSRQRSSSAESLIRGAPTGNPAVGTDALGAAPQQPEEQADEEHDYSDMLNKLRANRKAAPSPADAADEKRKKRRQLGRAPSSRSNPSATEDSAHIDLNDPEDENSVPAQEFQPSQQLGWDSPGAAQAREQMIRKLGGTVKETSVPAEGIGVVKDAVKEGGLGRASRRRG